jgi:hypothetical protein
MTSTALILFIGNFALVALLGLQQINVERRSMVAAALTSPLISGCVLIGATVIPQGISTLESAAFIVGAAAGIVFSIWVHPVLVQLFEPQGELVGDAAPCEWKPASEFVRERDAAPTLTPSPTLSEFGERLGERLRLATALADLVARSDVETNCAVEQLGQRAWHDTSQPDPHSLDLTRSLRYLELRGHLQRHPVQRHLVRIES